MICALVDAETHQVINVMEAAGDDEAIPGTLLVPLTMPSRVDSNWLYDPENKEFYTVEKAAE